MSDIEQSILDDEIMEMANQGCNKPEAAEQHCEGSRPVEKCCEGTEGAGNCRFWPDVMKSIEKEKKEAEEREKAMHRKWRRRRIIMTATWVSICAAAVAALITVLYVPSAIPWVVNIGTMCFVVAGAILIDRAFIRCRI